MNGKFRNERIEKIVDLWRDEEFQSRNVEHVRINRNRILTLAIELAKQDLTAPDWKHPDLKNILPKDDLAFVSYLPYICAVNFSFTDFRSPFQRFRISDPTGVYYGSQAMYRCFYRRFGEKKISAASIINIASSGYESRKFFAGDTPLPLLAQRRRNLVEVAQIVGENFQNDPMKIFEAGGMSIFEDESSTGILNLIELYLPKGFGNDCVYYNLNGINVPLRFSKRAQLWMMLYQGRALGSNGALPLLAGSEALGPIADSATPNALREYGILDYDERLSKKIDSCVEFNAHSPEVLEIRMATVFAFKSILESVNTRRWALGKNSTSFLALDYALWQIGRNIQKPTHLSSVDEQ